MAFLQTAGNQLFNNAFGFMKKKKKKQVEMEPTEINTNYMPVNDTPTNTNTQKELPLEERQNILKSYGDGYSIDKYGNVTKGTDRFGNPTQETKDKILRTQSIAASQGGVESPLNEDKRRAAAQQQLQIQQENQAAFQEVQQGLPTQESLQAQQGSNIDESKMIGGVAAGLVPAAVGTALTVGTGGAGAVAGIPLISAGIYQIYSSLRGQQSDNYADDKLTLTKGASMLPGLIKSINDPANPNRQKDILLAGQIFGDIDEAHRRVYLDNQNDLNKWLNADGSRELKRFRIYEEYVKPQLLNDYYLAINNPDPNKINTITQEDYDYAQAMGEIMESVE